MNTSKLHVELRVGESFQIGDACITLSKKDGQRARLVVNAPRDLTITRPHSQPSAQECASSPDQGKEHPHGQYPL